MFPSVFRLFFLCFVFFMQAILPCRAQEQELVVCLDSESTRLPIFIEPIEQETSELSSSYLQSLSAIFTFDINYNGFTSVISSKDKKRYEELKANMGFSKACDFKKCKDLDLYYLIKMKIQGKNLVTKVISINGQTTKTVEGITLTGDLNKDRRSIHYLADSLSEMLFQKRGIASCRIIFTEKKKVKSGLVDNWVSEVFESDYDGANKTQLTSEDSFCVHPLYVPGTGANNNPCYLFVSYKIGQPKIYFAPVKDGKVRRLSQIRGNQLTPQVSKDGTKVAFACDATGRSDLFIHTFNTTTGAIGKPLQIFTAKGATNASPSFSPDGKKIAFVSNKDGSPKIYIMDIPSPNTKLTDVQPTLISKRCRENTAPSWSPDGKKITYCASSGGPRQIWVYDLETKQERQLTDGKGHKENPAWAENSLHIMFNVTSGQTTDLYLLNLNQPDAVKITDGTGEKRFPSWKVSK